MGVTGDVPSREGLVQRAQGVGPVIWGHLPPFAGSDWGGGDRTGGGATTWAPVCGSCPRQREAARGA